jgi:hypothetical protein
MILDSAVANAWERVPTAIWRDATRRRPAGCEAQTRDQATGRNGHRADGFAHPWVQRDRARGPRCPGFLLTPASGQLQGPG